MGMYNIQVPPVGMRIPVTPNAKAPSSVPRKKSKEGSRVEQTMNAQDEIKELKQRIDELEQQVREEQRFPQVEDDYWCVNNDTEVSEIVWYGDNYDQGRLSIGNVFKTEEEAEFVVEKLKVEAELRKFSRPFEEGENNYHISFETYDKFIDIDSLLYRQTQGVFYFESREKVENAIESVGEERIKKYIFEVED